MFCTCSALLKLLICDKMSEDDMFYCSFVSIHYIICECGETFPTEDALRLHLEKEHPHKRERKEYKCGICEATFSTEQQCIDHCENLHIDIKQEHDYVEAEYSQNSETFNEIDDYVCYEEEVEDKKVYNVICEVCGQLYQEDSEHTCPVENEETEDKEEKEEPYLLKPVEKNKKYYDPTKKVVCEVCGKKYASNAALRYHQRVHTGERPYQCTMCHKNFTMPLFLQIHIRTHTGERPYECTYPHCQKAFSNKAALLRHDRVHTGVKPYKCPQCGKFFTQSNSMKLHVNTVHLKMPAPYKKLSRKHKLARREAKDQKPSENTTAVQNMVSSMPETNLSEAEMHLIKPEANLYQVQEGDVMYEEDMERGVTYEIVYEE